MTSPRMIGPIAQDDLGLVSPQKQQCCSVPNLLDGERQPARPVNIHVDMLKFERKLDLEEFVKWLQSMERIFEYEEIPEDRQVKVPTLQLRKYASLWWENLNR
ncbi:hypothetical protein MLD38_035465 [Melastoma candidum]|uniref:Uncharacterized protein n=1 Tax=Melastoma candidum TaxID=119954 RepID=A0ACB9LGW7_9MYRT|nr:hypothetical protein MLD38_035465 [Melastoma candidum]